MGLVGDVIEPNNLRVLFDLTTLGREVAADLREDLSFAKTLARRLTPLARFEKAPQVPDPIFDPEVPLSVPSLKGKRIALCASGGSGATAALCGIKRALEEAGLEVAAISACSGATLFGSLWAMGLSAEDIARFWLSLRTSDYLDPDWTRVGRGLVRGFRRWGGVVRGDALERIYDERLGGALLGDTEIPFWAVVWNIDRNQVEFLSTRDNPGIPLARAVRCAISIPIFVEPVRIGEHLYGDGGIVDVFPARPILDELDSYDLVIGVNSYLPADFEGTDVGGWYDHPLAILEASGQLRYAIYLELAREHVRDFGSKLRLLQPVPHEEVRGAKFYESFLDRSSWHRFMRLGHQAMRDVLVSLAQEDPASVTAAASR